MCIRDSYKELLSWRNELRALKDGDVAEYDTGNNGVAYVSYTHLDVYKRQGLQVSLFL